MNLDENDFYNHSFSNEKITDEHIIENEFNEEIHNAINQLSEVQKNRIIKHYFYNMRIKEIADEEGVSLPAVTKSINQSLEKLKKLIKF